MKKIFLIIFIVLSLTSFSFADRIYLKNGQILKGKVEEEIEGYVWVKIRGGRVLFSKEEIESIEKDIYEEVRQKKARQKRPERLKDYTEVWEAISLLLEGYYNVFLENPAIAEKSECNKRK